MSFTLYHYDGRGNIPDGVFHWFWERMEEQGLAQPVFYSGHVTDSYGFTLLMKTTVVPSIAIDDDTKKPTGMAWLSDVIDKRALGHFVVLKAGRKDKIDMARQMAAHWLNGLGLQVVLGIVPSFNKPALKYLNDMGMITLGEVPGLVCVKGEYQSAFIAYFSREEL